uniref:Uncharacterized protein n=1 Tax=Anguilla anguilla TaxID=7936 RepID=A0A0E9QEJ0_ANGAN
MFSQQHSNHISAMLHRKEVEEGSWVNANCRPLAPVPQVDSISEQSASGVVVADGKKLWRFVQE